MVRRARARKLLTAVGLVALGCASTRPPSTPAGAAVEIVWPAPPQPARIRYLRTVERPRDLGIRASIWQRMQQFLSGGTDEGFVRPTSVAADGQVWYIADPGAHALWILDAAAGRQRAVHAAGTQALVSPVAVALRQGDGVYLVDSQLRKVFVFSADGRLSASIADPRFRSPSGIAYDRQRDRLYVTDSAAHTVWVLDGEGIPTGSIGERGTGDTQFNFPTHISVDQSGTIYVIDALNFRLQMFDAGGKFMGRFGQHGDTSGEFAMPKGLAIDSKGHIYIVEALFDAVQIFDRQGDYLLTFGRRGTGPGEFWLPSGAFIDDRDRIYIADAYNQRVQVFQYVGTGDD